mgnify:CR=1 FL=1
MQYVDVLFGNESEAEAFGEKMGWGKDRALNIHTFVKFDEFLMNLSPNLIRDRRNPY